MATVGLEIETYAMICVEENLNISYTQIFFSFLPRDAL